MRNSFLIVSLLLMCSAAHAQIKYKDLVLILEDMGHEEAKYALKEYLQDDLDHPNANFRLALMYESNYRKGDVLTHYEYSIANAEQARLRYTKAKQLVDEREVSRNNEWYATSFGAVDAKGRPFVDYPVVAEKITRGLDSSVLFLARVPAIYKNFTKSVNHYDNAVKNFGHINSEFLSLDDIYLTFDPAFDKRLTQLKQHYDSARYYFDQYLLLTKAYPIAHHKQRHHVKPIVTYRLDGLITHMNFLTSDVEFWDYSTWVDHVRKSVSDEIVSLRTRLSQNEVRLTDNLAKITASSSADLPMVGLDKQVVFNLNNYEKSSLVLALLEYKHFKQDWLLKTKTYSPDTTNGERNALLYSALIYSNRRADTLLNTVRTRSTKEKIRKHSEFIDKHYGGPDGLHKYTEAEAENIRVTFEQYTGGLRSALLNMVTSGTKATAGKVVRFSNKWNVSTAVQTSTPEMLAKGDPITQQRLRGADGSVYLIGIHKPDKKTNLTAAFIARVLPDGKAGWLQSITDKVDSLAPAVDAHNQPGPVELTQDGCVAVIRATHSTQPQVRNVFIYLNEKGETKFHVRLAERSVARKVTFNERTNSFVLLFKGQAEAGSLTSSENLTILSVNALGDKQWRRQISMAGDITGLVNLMDGHLLSGNFTVLRDLSGKEYTAKAGESLPYVVKWNDRGDIERIVPIASAKPAYITNLVKVNDRSINLVGREGVAPAAASQLTPDDAILHIMTNRLCETVCTNLPK